MLEILRYGFMQRAFLAGIIVAVICPAIGIFLVLRRMSMIGDTLSHVALAGVAGGMLGGIYPVYSALGFSVLAALAIEGLSKEYEQYKELSIAIIFSAGIGLATIFISLGNSNSAIFSYLFGSIGLVSSRDIWIIFILGLYILISILFFYRHLFYIAFDEEAARLAGVPVKWINLYFIILVAMTIAISMRIVGVLLVSSLMIVPVATSLQLVKSFKQTFICSILFGVLSVVIGLFISFYVDLAPGGTIVISSILILIVVILIKHIKG
ncbi:MAG TPA: metal ABC transporter permease [Clostridia bacterium]|nr:metal ABC transporter permease [Clostridia bacterium]